MRQRTFRDERSSGRRVGSPCRLTDLHKQVVARGVRCLFIIAEKARARERRGRGVGVMKDKELKLGSSTPDGHKTSIQQHV